MSLDQTESSPPSSFTARKSPVATTTRTAQPAAEENRRTSSIGAGASARRRARRSTRIGHEAADPHARRDHVQGLDGLLDPGRRGSRCVPTGGSGRRRDDAGHAQQDEPPTGRRARDRDRPRRGPPARRPGATRTLVRCRTTGDRPARRRARTRSANSITIAPAAAKQPATSAIERRPGMAGPIVHRPASARPIESRMPTYSIALPIDRGRRGRRGRGLLGLRRAHRSRVHADPEREGAGRRMAVGGRDHGPRHRVDAVGQVGGERHRERPRGVALDGRSGLHLLAAGVEHRDRRERQVRRFGEDDGHLGGRLVEHHAGRRIGGLEFGMGAAGPASRATGRTPRTSSTIERRIHARFMGHLPS